jgi:hypothetical protein
MLVRGGEVSGSESLDSAGAGEFCGGAAPVGGAVSGGGVQADRRRIKEEKKRRRGEVKRGRRIGIRGGGEVRSFRL